MQTTVVTTHTNALPPPVLEKQGIARKMLGGTSALTLAMAAERGLTFLANMLAARMGGASSFGAYSLALTTANNIASYAGAGIGSTATRFGGTHLRTSPSYRTLTRALIVISLTSAILAYLALYLAAHSFAATLLHNRNLAPLLRWSAFCSGAMILVECCRGFLIGQKQFSALFALSATAGTGMLLILPLASQLGPNQMVLGQALVGLIAVAVVLMGSRYFGFSPSGDSREDTPLLPMLRRIWSFGFVQLAGVAGLNAAGWWVTTLVARADTTLKQMAFLAVSSQLRNLVALIPGMLTQISYAMLAEEGEQASEPGRVLLLGSFFATALAFGAAAIGVIMMPWLLPILFGQSYHAGVMAVCLALATAVVHMGSAPAAARLTIVSLKATGWINAVWAVAAVLLAIWLVPRGGAAEAMGVYLAVHLLSLFLVLAALHHAGDLAHGMTKLSVFTAAGGLGLGVLAWLRAAQVNMLPLTVALVLFAIAFLGALYGIGRSLQILPPGDEVLNRLRRRTRISTLQAVEQ